MIWLLAAAAVAPPPGPIRFEEIAEQAGARVVHHTRTFSGKHADVLGMFTAGGAAVAVGDYDNDGDEDLFFTDSQAGKPCHLLKSEWKETGKLAFTEVTEAAGVAGGNDARSIVSDALFFDADNDGWQDLLVARFGTPLLYRNLGNGKLAEVGAAAGLTKLGNTIAALAFDYDNDGRLDLLFGNYFQPVNLLELPTPHVLPDNLDAATNGGGVTLWRNVTEPGASEVRFVEVTEKAGLAHHTGWTLDAGHADLDNDGWQDLYLAGDYGTDRLFWNNRDGTFRDATKEAIGIDTRKGMNVDVGDYNRDGWLDVYVTNITDEYMKECNMLWHNDGDGTFTDLSKETGTCNTLWGWAAKFGDFDNDGWEDLFAVDGLRSAGPENYIPVLLEMIITPDIDFTDVRNWPAIGTMTWSGYQKKKLFRNLGTGTFKEMAAQAGVDNDRDGRGVGLADLDQDGRLDLVQTNANQPSLLYRGATAPAGHWLALQLVGTRSNRDAVGARVTVKAGGVTQIREVNGGNGYASQSSKRLHFGLGAAETIDSVEVRWPSGTVQKVKAAVDALTTVQESPPPSPELLWHYRNLGKAFYENPTTQYEAVEQLKKALDLAPESARERVNHGLALLKAGKTAEGVAELEAVQKKDPSVPHTWFNLGIAYKREARYDEATAQFERMVALVPDEAISHYNLGVLYKLAGKAEPSLSHFETAARLNPKLAGPRFQLYNAYKAAGRDADAARELEVFREIKKEQEGAAIPEDLEWSWYSEIWDEPAAAPEEITPAKSEWERRELARGLDPVTAGLALLDAEGDGRTDLLAWSAKGIHLFSGGATRIDAGLPSGALDVAPGDFDNDGLADLAVVNADGVALYRNDKGRFSHRRGEACLARSGEGDACVAPTGRYRKAVWLDFDHDYDLDLLLLGESAALFRNNGGGSWSDETRRFPFVAGKALAAVVFDVVADSQGMDLAVAYEDRPGVLYRDRLGGSYEAETLAAIPAGVTSLSAFDANRDGWTDLAAGESLRVNQKGKGWEDGGSRPPPVPSVASAAADFDGDGALDLAAVEPDGTLVLLRSTAPAGRFLSVSLEGVKNLKLAPHAEVEVKAGSSYQKKTYRGTPLVFDLGTRAEADAVRITWPNGLIQNETRQPAGAHAYKEAPRLSGSCPMIFTWNGEHFEFITDVLGVAPLGAAAGDGEYFPVDHDEFIQVPGRALAEQDGRYEVRITEELREVAYLDQIELYAVDRPAEVEVFTNDKFKGPPFPDFRLFGVAEKAHPVAARDHRGRDVRDRLLARDRSYPDGFVRDASGVAELHALELDFEVPAAADAVLVLSGWVDWADGSTFLGAAQQPGGGLVMPRLLAQDAGGSWVTVDEDMGIPAGKPKTIVVDLQGKLPPLGPRLRLRIETNLCVYWDEIFLAEPRPPLDPPVAVPLLSARLAYRGFSRPVIHPERKQPESFDYQSWMPVSMWNPTPGLYTRYGAVDELLAAVDDRMVVMGSGDEIRLAFDAAALPPPPPGYVRDFLLKVDGWAKDGDANTAFSQTVEPLPFHGMTRYPYPPAERFPDDPGHTLYRDTYNTRPALRLLRPLRPVVSKEVERP